VASEKRSYSVEHDLVVNDIVISEIIIDSHVDKHSDHISDQLIFSLVKQLDGNTYVPTSQNDEFSYFVTNVVREEYTYRLVWLIEDGAFYIGVITAFRDRGVKQ
jgi:hypothetical protein